MAAREREDLRPPVRVFPDLVVSAATAAVLLMCIYSVLCIFFPATLDVRADTLAPSVTVKPAWYFLFLYGLLRAAHPLVGAFALIVLAALLVAVPYLDRSPAVRPRSRFVALVVGAAAIVLVLVFSYAGWRM